MKNKILLGFLLLGIIVCQGQELISDDSIILKPGIYKTFEEFKTHILGEGYKSNILGTSKNNPPIN